MVLNSKDGNNAYADNGTAPLLPSTNTITAVVDDDGSIVRWEPESIELINIDNGKHKYTIKDSELLLTDAVRDVEGLDSVNVKITGFGNDENEGVVFDGTAGDAEAYIPSNLIPLASGFATDLKFEINTKLDASIVNDLLNKEVFNVRLTHKLYEPSTLEEYTWLEIKDVADRINKGEIDASEMEKFKKFAEEGQTKTLYLGSDHSETVTSSDRLYMRIIGFNHDELTGSAGDMAGITFMAANAINTPYYYEDATTEKPTNWQKSKLRSSMNETNGEIYNVMFNALKAESVAPVSVSKKYARAWEDSSNYDPDTILSSDDFFFLPSYSEVTGKTDYPSSETVGNEGDIYPYFKNDLWKNSKDCIWHKDSFAGSVMNSINWMGYLYFQDKGPLEKGGSSLLPMLINDAFSACDLAGGCVNCEKNSNVWTRSVCPAYDDSATLLDFAGDAASNWYVNVLGCVAPCFCLGGESSEPEPPVPPEPYGKRVPLQETISGTTYRYAPVFECENGQTAANLGYHFFASETAVYEIKGTDGNPVDSMEDLSDYIQTGLWVEVEEGKGVGNSGKCIAMRLDFESFNLAAYGDDSSTSTDPITEYKGQKSVPGDYWCGLSWQPEIPTESNDFPPKTPLPTISYVDSASSLNTSINVQDVIDAYYWGIYDVHKFWSSVVWIAEEEMQRHRVAYYWDSSAAYNYWDSTASLSGSSNNTAIVFSRAFGGSSE